jgi:hypothetical protein
MLETETVVMERPAAQPAGILLAKLSVLHKQSGKGAFQRLAIAAELLADKQWVHDQHQGDPIKARDWLETDYFGDLCGANMTLGQLLLIQERLPTIEQWAEHKFNLGVLWEIVRPKSPRQPPARTAPTKEEIAQIQDEAAHWHAVANELERQLVALKKENADLQRRLRERETKA